MPSVQPKFAPAPSKKTVDRQPKKAARQQGRLLISRELTVLQRQHVQVPVRELAPYLNF